MEILRFFLALAGFVAAGTLLALVWRSKRRLDQRVAQYLREQEESQAPINPYLGLAELYAEDERKNEAARRNKKGRG